MKFCDRPEWINPGRAEKGARARGVKYERIIQKRMQDRFSFYEPSPWMHFVSEEAPEGRYACPDGLLIDKEHDTITIVEIKLKHTANAWWQVRGLYEPLVRAFYGDAWRYRAFEIMHWFDATVPFPETIKMTQDPAQIADPAFAPDHFGVCWWKR